MGYRSDFHLDIEQSILSIDGEVFKNSLKKVTGYSWEMWDDTSFSLTGAKWSDYENDIAKISDLFPDYHISMRVIGEEEDDRVIVDALAGTVHLRQGEMVYPERTLW